MKNKVTNSADEAFIADAFPDYQFIRSLPYSEEIRQADRDGVAVLDLLSEKMVEKFESVLDELTCQK